MISKIVRYVIIVILIALISISLSSESDAVEQTNKSNNVLVYELCGDLIIQSPNRIFCIGESDIIIFNLNLSHKPKKQFPPEKHKYIFDLAESVLVIQIVQKKDVKKIDWGRINPFKYPPEEEPNVFKIPLGVGNDWKEK